MTVANKKRSKTADGTSCYCCRLSVLQWADEVTASMADSAYTVQQLAYIA